MKIAKKFKSKHQWTRHGGQAAFMALEPDTREKDEKGEPSTAGFDYDVVYFWTSQYVHATIRALEGHACERGAVYCIGIRRWAEQGLRTNVLFNVLVFVSKIFISGCRILHEEQPEEILRDMHVMMGRFTRIPTPFSDAI